MENSLEKPTSGRRNLILLGIVTVFIAISTTSIELLVYKSSGDIYLDRSRPGYLPDAEEAEEEAASASSAYRYPETGVFDTSELEEYLTEFKALRTRLQKLPDPYSADPLSDASLGI